MTEAELRERLRHEPVPGEREARDTSWEVVRGAFAVRERVPWIERRRRPLFALAVLLALAVAAVTPPGRAVVARFEDAIAPSPSEPALVRLPAPGRLLVVSQSGPWVVREDGSKRLLGDYADASWSPRGLYVVAAQGRRLVALDAETGDARWSLSRAEPIRDPRWSGGGLDTRIAYRAGPSLHVVAGDGSPDAVLASDVAPVAPAWRGDTHVLAYASRDGRVHVVDADARRELWRTAAIAGVRRLAFSGDGLLVVLTERNARLYGRRGLIRLAASPELPKGHVFLDAALLSGGRVLYADYDRDANATSLVLAHCFRRDPCLLVGPSQRFRWPGRIEDFTTSPNGRWLAAASPDADQLLFLRLVPRLGKVVAVSNVRREFGPGGRGEGTFPRLAGWTP